MRIADYFDRACDLLAEPHAPRTGHEADQFNAARRDTAAFMVALQQTGAFPHKAEHARSPRQTAITLALLAAIERRCDKRCRHVHGESRSTAPGLAELTAGVLACHGCFPGLVSGLVPVDDGHCDICDAVPPDDYFIPFVSSAADLTVAGNACSECAAFMDLPGAHARPARALRRVQDRDARGTTI
jgi:hypothetical protein